MSESIMVSDTFGIEKKTLNAYLTGFILCVSLTIMAFLLVELKVFDRAALYFLLPLLAITQLIVQSLCFLRLTRRGDGLWNLLPYLFVLMVISILSGGSLWIMYNLNANMLH